MKSQTERPKKSGGNKSVKKLRDAAGRANDEMMLVGGLGLRGAPSRGGIGSAPAVRLDSSSSEAMSNVVSTSYSSSSSPVSTPSYSRMLRYKLSGVGGVGGGGGARRSPSDSQQRKSWSPSGRASGTFQCSQDACALRAHKSADGKDDKNETFFGVLTQRLPLLSRDNRAASSANAQPVRNSRDICPMALPASSLPATGNQGGIPVHQRLAADADTVVDGRPVAALVEADSSSSMSAAGSAGSHGSSDGWIATGQVSGNMRKAYRSTGHQLSLSTGNAAPFIYYRNVRKACAPAGPRTMSSSQVRVDDSLDASPVLKSFSINRGARGSSSDSIPLTRIMSSADKQISVQSRVTAGGVNQQHRRWRRHLSSQDARSGNADLSTSGACCSSPGFIISSCTSFHCSGRSGKSHQSTAKMTSSSTTNNLLNESNAGSFDGNPRRLGARVSSMHTSHNLLIGRKLRRTTKSQGSRRTGNGGAHSHALASSSSPSSNNSRGEQHAPEKLSATSIGGGISNRKAQIHSRIPYSTHDILSTLDATFLL